MTSSRRSNFPEESDTLDEDVPSGAPGIGAPVEQKNPLGYDVGFISAVFLNLSRMIGVRNFVLVSWRYRTYSDRQSGIYSTPGSILNSVGSVGIYLIYWLLAPLITLGS